MRRGALVLLFVVIPGIAAAQVGDAGIDVVDVSGPLDRSALEFMRDSIQDAAIDGQALVLLQVNSKAVLDGDAYDRLIDLIKDPPLPVAAWVGPAPASALGGAELIVRSAGQAAIAPGSTWGKTNPVVLGEQRAEIAGPGEALSADESGLELQPTLRQYLQDLDGRTFPTSGGPSTISTITEFGEGVTLRDVTFIKPGLATRFFRLAVTPEAAFLFLVVGLSIVTFEFFALGPGVAAGVAALSLIPAGWGLLNLPTRWWALLLVLAGWGLLTAAYQKGGFLSLAGLGAVLLQVGGMLLIEGQGQIDPRWWLVAPTVLAVLFFFLIAMPTVQRARLSTQTIGRDSLIGQAGSALADFDPDGVVEVAGARWKATAHREAGLHPGSPVVVTGVDGHFLEVEPVRSDREK